MEFSKHNWAMISETICPKMLIFGKQASWTLFFQNILTNPIISEISFLWRHTLAPIVPSVSMDHQFDESYLFVYKGKALKLSTLEIDLLNVFRSRENIF